MLSVVGLSAGAVITIPIDWGRYATVLRDHGLVGFLGMPSLLFLQFGLLLTSLAFFVLALRYSPSIGLCVMVWLLTMAAGVYCLSLWLMYEASQAGEFGFGALGIVFVFGYVPSATFLLIGAPVTACYVLLRSCA
jgi:hypothetical protein